MLYLTIMRHGDAELNSASGLDIDRNLSKLGIENCKNSIVKFLTNSYVVDKILCSSANRCVCTFETIKIKLNPHKSPVLYNASIDTLLNEIKSTSVNCKHLMLIAHNPGLSMLLNHLTNSYNNIVPAEINTLMLDCKDWNRIESVKTEWIFTTNNQNKIS